MQLCSMAFTRKGVPGAATWSHVALWMVGATAPEDQLGSSRCVQWVRQASGGVSLKTHFPLMLLSNLHLGAPRWTFVPRGS